MNTKRLTALLLMLCMVFTMLPPVPTNAATEYYEEAYTYEIVDGGAVITGTDGSLSGDITIHRAYCLLC